MFNQRNLKRPGVILDAGCGTGGFLCTLAQALPQCILLGLDIDKMACEIARSKSGQFVCLGTANSLPFRDGCLTAIFSADLLCHFGVDQKRALQEFHRCLQSEGVLVLNLPAYPWLLSGHDRAVHNVRRYTSQDIRKLLIAAGFINVETTYWNTVLFPLMFLRRVLFSKAGESDVRRYVSPVETMFRMIMRFETFCLSRGLRFPYGGSVIAIAIKKMRSSN
jgi:SAM-dependent methyltransferase